MTWTWRQAGRARPGPTAGGPDGLQPLGLQHQLPLWLQGVPRRAQTCQHGSGPLATAVLQCHAHRPSCTRTCACRGCGGAAGGVDLEPQAGREGAVATPGGRAGRRCPGWRRRQSKTRVGRSGQMVPRAWVERHLLARGGPQALRQPLRWREGDDRRQTPPSHPPRPSPRVHVPLSSAVRASATVPCRARRHRQNGGWIGCG